MSRHTKILARSFAGGEMSPEMFSRLDDVKFQSGAEKLLNCIPRPTGAVTRRPGTRLIMETRDSGAVSFLFSFIYSQGQSSVIEAGRATIGGVDSGYFRFHTNGSTLLFPMASLGFKPALNTDLTFAFHPTQTVECSLTDPMTVTLTSHGLRAGDQIWFVSDERTLPDYGAVPANSNRPVPLVGYYLREVFTNSFKLSTSPTGSSRVTVEQHVGFDPVIANYSRWRGPSFPRRGMMVSEHRIQHLEPIAITMWPDSNSPTVSLITSFSGLSLIYLSSGPAWAAGLLKESVCNQQVIFVADGGTLPPNVVEGKLYWATSWVGSSFPTNVGWTFSETKNGPAFDAGGTSSGTIRMCVGPDAEGDQSFELMRRYYAMVIPGAPNTFNLERTVGGAQDPTAGLVFHGDGRGAGPFRVHRAYEKGDIVTIADPSGGIRSYYCEKSWWDPESPGDQGILTQEMHTEPGSLTPGLRSSAEQGAYWRELPGRATGAPVAFTAVDYVNPVVDQVFEAVSVSHGFVTGQAVAIVGGTEPLGFDLDNLYWAIVDSTTVIRLAASYDDAIAAGAGPTTDEGINGPTGQAPRHGSLMLQAFVEFDSTNLTDTVRWPSHGLNNGETVVFGVSALAASGHTMQGGLTAGTVYYVREADTDTFQVSETAIGALITFSGSDGDMVTAIGHSVYEVPHSYSEEELPRIGTAQSGDVMTWASQKHPVLELRRLSATKWETLEPEFIAAAPVPGPCFNVSILTGEGVQIVATRINSRHWFETVTEHLLQPGTPVLITGLPTSGAGSLAEGYYVVGQKSGQTGYERVLNLQQVDSNTDVGHEGIATGLDGRVRYGTQGEELIQRYVITAIDQNNEESGPNDVFEVAINLYVAGASATIGWGASLGAVRYRVYKEISGIYGMIGETDDLQFKDDNIGPDLAVAPPILDKSLRKQSLITFNATTNNVLWVNHGLIRHTPVVFKTSGEMPGVEEGKTYYVIFPGDDQFQLSDDTEVSTNLIDITGTDTGRHNAVAGDFPSTVTYFEGRRVFGGSRVRPQDIWMTASGTESDISYSIPTVDSDRIYFRIAARQVSSIRHLIPLSQLILFSDSTEYRLTPINDDALTPSSISVRPQSFIGCAYSQPSLVNNTVVFAAARGGHMRELGYSRDVLAYVTSDLSLRAGHLFDGFTIVDQAYAKAPLPVVWCVSSSGKLLGITYIPEEGISAWHQHTTGASGVFESITVVPEGDVDAVYVIVERTMNGVTKRFVERLDDVQSTVVLEDSYFVDCGLTYEGVATSTISGLDHLEGETVAYLADGVAGTGTVTAGVLTLSTAASTVHVGLGFTTDLKTLPLSMMRVDAFGTGRQKNITQIHVRIFESGAFEAGPDEDHLVPSRTPAAGSVDSGMQQVTLPGSWDDDGQVLIRQSDPLPLTVSGITLEVASGG